MGTAIIGIDCATEARKVGVARAVHSGGATTVVETAPGTPDLIETLSGWIASSRRVLLALGWPAKLGPALSGHQAGCVLRNEPNELFRRRADDVVAATVGPRPLDVGANWIARTAHAALQLLDQLRKKTGHPIPLAWSCPRAGKVEAIEVYPAATLRALGLPSSKYKKRDQAATREEIITGLRDTVALECDVGALLENADTLDAVVCVVAGADFLEGRIIQPTDTTVARKEGWIWVRSPRSARAVRDYREGARGGQIDLDHRRAARSRP